MTSRAPCFVLSFQRAQFLGSEPTLTLRLHLSSQEGHAILGYSVQKRACSALVLFFFCMHRGWMGLHIAEIHQNIIACDFHLNPITAWQGLSNQVKLSATTCKLFFTEPFYFLPKNIFWKIYMPTSHLKCLERGSLYMFISFLEKSM